MPHHVLRPRFDIPAKMPPRPRGLDAMASLAASATLDQEP